MTHDDGFVEYLCELLLPLGQAQGRPMFGGYGVYLDGLMIGLVIDGGFFLKADDLSKDRFLKAGCEPFVYHGQEKPITMSYWTVPAEALESEREMEPWARLAIAAAERKAHARKLEQKAEPRRARAAK
jgi:DNA transformation protein